MQQSQLGRRIAGKLVDGIVERNPNRAGIRLSCRKDYEAAACRLYEEGIRSGDD